MILVARGGRFRPRGGGATPWRIGVFLAPNVSWMKPTNTKSDDGEHRVTSDGSKVGFTWGLMADYYFSYNYAIETGFQLNTTGGAISTTNIKVPTDRSYVLDSRFNYHLQYLEVPFNLKLISDELPGGPKLFGQIGVSGGINISKKATYVVDYVEVDPITGIASPTQQASGEREKLLGTLSIAPVMFSLNVGGGVEYPVANNISIYAGIFFNNGFAPDVTNPANYELGYAGSFRDANTRLNNFAFRIGLIF